MQRAQIAEAFSDAWISVIGGDSRAAVLPAVKGKRRKENAAKARRAGEGGQKRSGGPMLGSGKGRNDAVDVWVTEEEYEEDVWRQLLIALDRILFLLERIIPRILKLLSTAMTDLYNSDPERAAKWNAELASIKGEIDVYVRKQFKGTREKLKSQLSKLVDLLDDSDLTDEAGAASAEQMRQEIQSVVEDVRDEVAQRVTDGASSSERNGVSKSKGVVVGAEKNGSEVVEDGVEDSDAVRSRTSTVGKRE